MLQNALLYILADSNECNICLGHDISCSQLKSNSAQTKSVGIANEGKKYIITCALK